MQKHVVLTLRKKLKPSLSLPILAQNININITSKAKRLSNKANILNYFVREEEEKIKEICDYDCPALFFSLKDIKSQHLQLVERRKSISNQFVFKSSPNQIQGTKSRDKEMNTNAKMKYERIQQKEINELQDKIQQLEEEYNTKTAQINVWNQEIDNCNLELKAVQISSEKAPYVNVPNDKALGINALSKKQKENHIMRSLTNIEISVKTQKELIKQCHTDINNLMTQIKILKTLLKRKKAIMLEYYHNILLKGKDTRSEGLVWVIKAIWNLGSDIQMKFIPTFLDEKAINYLFDYANKTEQVKIKSKEIAEIKESLGQQNHQKLFRTNIRKSLKQSNLINSFSDLDKRSPIEFLNKLTQSGNDIDSEPMSLSVILSKPSNFDDISLGFLSLMFKLEQEKSNLVKEMSIMKDNEMKRLTKEYFDNDYEKRFMVTQSDVISALIGEDNKDKELYKQNIIKKEYMKKIKMCNFYKANKDNDDD